MGKGGRKIREMKRREARESRMGRQREGQERVPNQHISRTSSPTVINKNDKLAPPSTILHIMCCLVPSNELQVSAQQQQLQCQHCH